MRPHRRSHPWVVPVIALGGMLGAGGRYALELAWPHGAGSLPWSTLVTNASGCLLIGALMVYVVEVGAGALRHPLVRPFVGVGILGGYTTFSTYSVQSENLVAGDRPLLGLAYLVGTPIAALVAVVVGMAAARTLARRRPGYCG
jgi:CrcB protein